MVSVASSGRLVRRSSPRAGVETLLRKLGTGAGVDGDGYGASFDLPRVRDEVFQNWLIAEAKSDGGSKIRAQYCCFTHHDAVKAYRDDRASWHWLDKELSSNMAGETGAVQIYRGALAAMSLRPGSFTEDAREFVRTHMQNELGHLRLFGSIVPTGKYTTLLPIWRVAGWTLGFGATFVGGTRGLYVTVEAVETFVEDHYQQQIGPLKEAGSSPELVRLLEHCCEDEVHHKEDAAKRLLGPDDQQFSAWWVSPWTIVVQRGSSIAAEIARRV